MDKKAKKKIDKRFKADEDWWANRQAKDYKRWGHIRRGTDCADGVDPLFSYDITGTKKPLAWLKGEMRDAEYHAALSGGGRMPILVIFPKDRDRKKGFVVMLVEDWLNTHVDGREQNE